jgi:hypothetical protein
MSIRTLTSSFNGGECRNLSFGLVTKARACKVTDQKGGPGVTSHAPGNAKSVKE